ncbi:MAG: tetratricopeptide repeat protein [Nitrospirae bacterium]|nr:tetratricopeptide repeat protein [Nitrospirota bacterium]
MKKFAVLALFCFLLLPGLSAAEDYYESQLNKGIRNSEVYSYLLMQEARGNRAEAVSLLNRAIQYSPDLPAVYFAMAREKFSFTSAGVLASVDYIVAGIDAYSRNFWWSFSLAGGLFFSLVLSFIMAMLSIAVIRSITDLPLVSHEVGESKQNFVLLIALLILSLISPLLFLAAILVILGLYMSRMDRAVVYFFLFMLLVSPLIFRTASYFLHVSSSGKMKAIVGVNESRDPAYALTELKDADDPASLFSYALALKRTGMYHEALAAYNRLLRMRPDARTYVDAGNAYVGLDDMQEALRNFQTAVTIQPLASAYYNLSVVSRELLDYEKGNEYYRKALETDRDAVSVYQSLAARTPNRIVADEPFSAPALWRIARDNSGTISAFNLVALPVWANVAAALLLAAALFFLTSRSKNKAYRCRRCTAIFCPRCEKHIMWGQMCSQCFRSLVKLDETEVKERVARLMSIYEHQKKRRDISKVLSFLLPGAAQVFGGKVLYGLLFMWPFLFLLLLPLTNAFVSSGPMISHWVVNSFSLLFAAIVYILSNIITRQRIAKGWL